MSPLLRTGIIACGMASPDTLQQGGGLGDNMIARIIGISAVAYSLAVGAAQASVVATPGPPEIFVDLTISFVPTPPEIIPGDAKLTGVASFFNRVQAGDGFLNFPQGGFDIGSLSPGQSFTTSFAPPGPCNGGVACTFNFSFNGLTGLFGTQAFLSGDGLPNAVPSPPEIFPILIPGNPVIPGNPIHEFGPLVAFDDPVVVGQWDITLRATTIPLPATLPLFAGGLAGLGWLARRRRKQAA